MNESNHCEKVINYCIDNKVSFEEGYVAIIDRNLNNVEERLHDLRRDVEFTIEDVRCSY